MITTRSQSLAKSSPQAAPAPQEPESPESIPSQESPLSPEWIHAITNLIGPPIDIRDRTKDPEMDPQPSSLTTPTL